MRNTSRGRFGASSKWRAYQHSTRTGPSSASSPSQLALGNPPSGRITQAKHRSVQRRAAPAGIGPGHASQGAIGAYPKQQVTGDILGMSEEGTTAVLAVVKRYWTHAQQRTDALELIGGVRTGGGIAFDPLVQQGHKPTPFRLWHDPKGTVAMPDGDRFLAFNRRRLMLKGPIVEGARLGPSPRGMISYQQGTGIRR